MRLFKEFSLGRDAVLAALLLFLAPLSKKEQGEPEGEELGHAVCTQHTLQFVPDASVTLGSTLTVRADRCQQDVLSIPVATPSPSRKQQVQQQSRWDWASPQSRAPGSESCAFTGQLLSDSVL